MPRAMVGWTVACCAALVYPFVVSDDYVLGVFVLFGIYTATNLMWTLVLGTAGLQSFATLAVVGISVYAASYTSIAFGWPWPVMLVVGTLVGVPVGFAIALPAIRLRGVYFALFTLGLVELCRTYILQDTALGASKGLYGADSFVPRDLVGRPEGAMIGYFGAFALVVVALAVFWLVDRGRLGLLLRASRESEPFAQATGVDTSRVRLAVFLISSAVLGLVGAFYASYYRGVSPDIFRFDTLLMLLAMMVVGGLGSAGGVFLGTGLLLAIDQVFRDYGAARLMGMGLLMLLVTLFTTNGLAGIPGQIRQWVEAGEPHPEPVTGGSEAPPEADGAARP